MADETPNLHSARNRYIEETIEQYGACLGHDPDTFFPDDGDYAPAKAICDTCDVRIMCLNYALDNNIKDGMWGGWSPEKRRKHKRKQRWLRRQEEERQETINQIQRRLGWEM